MARDKSKDFAVLCGLIAKIIDKDGLSHNLVNDPGDVFITLSSLKQVAEEQRESQGRLFPAKPGFEDLDEYDGIIENLAEAMAILLRALPENERAQIDNILRFHNERLTGVSIIEKKVWGLKDRDNDRGAILEEDERLANGFSGAVINHILAEEFNLKLAENAKPSLAWLQRAAARISSTTDKFIDKTKLYSDEDIYPPLFLGYLEVAKIAPEYNGLAEILKDLKMVFTGHDVSGDKKRTSPFERRALSNIEQILNGRNESRYPEIVTLLETWRDGFDISKHGAAKSAEHHLALAKNILGSGKLTASNIATAKHVKSSHKSITQIIKDLGQEPGTPK